MIKRLGTFDDYLSENSAGAKTEAVVETLIEPRFALSHLTVKTPSDDRVPVADLSLEVPEKQSILVMGPSGVGKSSLLRAIAGLWNAGSGYIYRPRVEEILFLPQRPYMVLGSLREQILYPDREKAIADEHLQQILEKVNLADLAVRVGGFDTELNWADILSLGEQQRLGFARLFLSESRFAVLDESTSALDVENEKHLYRTLQDSGITYISVGHRPTLARYHRSILEISGGGKWRIVSPEEYERSLER